MTAGQQVLLLFCLMFWDYQSHGLVHARQILCLLSAQPSIVLSCVWRHGVTWISGMSLGLQACANNTPTQQMHLKFL